MRKLLLLCRVLRKCGHAEKTDASASAHTGNLSELMGPILGVAVAVAMFFAGRFLAQNQAVMGTPEVIFNTIMTLGCIAAFFLTIPQVINQLYMNNDLDVLITLPFSDMQLVGARLLNVSRLPLLITCAAIIPCGLGFGITAGGFGVLFWVGLVLSAPLLSLSMVSLAGILIILLMRAFRFIRSRTMLSVISTLIIFALTMVYVAFNNNSASIDMTQVFAVLSSSMSGMAKLFPAIGLCLSGMLGGGVLPLLGALAITAALIALLLLCARLFYFAAALGMQDANGRKMRLTTEALDKRTRASGLRAALRRREIRTILRTPALINNGYLFSIVLPIVSQIPLGIQLYHIFTDALAGAGMVLTLADIRSFIAQMNIGWETWCLAVSGLSLLMSSLAVGASVLSRGCISRDGKDYYTLKAMPIPAETLVMAKRDVAMVFCGISGVLLPVGLVIAGAVIGVLPVWTIAVTLVTAVLWLVFAVDLCCLFGVNKPNLNWDAEADACKNNVPGLVLWIVCLVLLLAALVWVADSEMDMSLVLRIGGIAFCVLPVVLAVVFDTLLRGAAARLPERY